MPHMRNLLCAIVEFCGGLAHKGMADRTIDLLKHAVTTNAITRGLDENPGYQLILTGHSLGAGIAALLTIKLHFDGHPLVRRNIHCFGFGCPPVFGSPVSSPSMQGMVGFQRVKKAFARTVCFINGEDVIPFMSIDAIRRLATMLIQVDAITATLSPIDQLLLSRGLKKPSDDLNRIVKDGSINLKPLPGAERLKVPGRFVVWMDNAVEDNPQSTKSDVVLCRPSKISNLAIRLADEFILDHLPPRYEERFKDLALH
jgi:hypothetical protein